MKKETKNKVIKLLLILIVFVLIFLAIFLPLKLTGVLDSIDSAEELKQVIQNGGIYSVLIFFAIQFLQVSLLPIPAIVTTVAGSLVFGPWVASIVSIIAVILASLFSFFLGRKFGYKLLNWAVGKETTDKWKEKLDRGKYVFFLMMLFPLFPDDILCLIVGATTNMSYKFFLITNIITRPISIVMTAFLGGGHLIPFSGWGIPVWICLAIIGIILFYLSFKFQPQIEDFIFRVSSKKEKDNDKNDNKLN